MEPMTEGGKPMGGNKRFMALGALGLLALAVVVVLALGVQAAVSYNRMVTLREGIPAAWSQVENVLQRRYDLIPNLVATVKGYAKHERELLTEVTKLRSQWGAAKTPDDKRKTATELEGVLSRLLIVAENYPNIKADESFNRLHDELAGTENRIAVERMRYNEMVRTYNTYVKQFPSNLIAAMFGFKTNEAYFQMAKEATAAPKVEF
jgi:LemA protein